MNVEWLLFLPKDQGKPHWEKVILEKNSEGGERTNHAGVWGKSVPGREREWKSCKAGACLTCLQNSREASVGFHTL